MVIITAAIVVLVMVSGSYALQVLERQQASSEFEAMQKSFLAFDDAIRDVAWKGGASRSVRFAINRGSFQMISDTRSFKITFNGETLEEFDTAVIKYTMQNSYVTLGSGYSSFILGNNMSAVSSVTDSLGLVLVQQESGLASISLSYRIRVSSPYTLDSGSTNYVDILIIKLSSADLSIDTGDFDLAAKNMRVRTEIIGPIEVNPGEYDILVSAEGLKDTTIPIQLNRDQVIFNLITSEVKVSP